MLQIVILFYVDYCFEGVVFEVKFGEIILDVVLCNGIEIEYVCEKFCVCMICYVIVCEGFDFMELFDEFEDDMLDKVWGLEFDLWLFCQVVVVDEDLVVEIFKYIINQVLEGY